MATTVAEVLTQIDTLQAAVADLPYPDTEVGAAMRTDFTAMSGYYLEFLRRLVRVVGVTGSGQTGTVGA